MPKKRTEKITDRIFEALCTLLLDEHKDYNELTIQDIVDKAEVCRNSFYRNYTSRDDILLNKFNEVFPLSADSSNETPFPGMDDLLKGLFNEIIKHQRLLKALYLANPGKYFQLISSHIIRSNNPIEKESLSKQEYYWYACKAWISLGIFTEWIQRDFDASIEELCQLLKDFNLYSPNK